MTTIRKAEDEIRLQYDIPLCPICKDDDPDDLYWGWEFYCTNCGHHWRPDGKPLRH